MTAAKTKKDGSKKSPARKSREVEPSKHKRAVPEKSKRYDHGSDKTSHDDTDWGGPRKKKK